MGQISRIRERASFLIEQELRDLDIEGVLPAHGSILHFLFAQQEPVSMTAIVEKAGRVKSTVTGMVNTLEQNGYVEKFASPEDGRVVLVKLTEKGTALKEPFDEISVRLIRKSYGDMSQKDRHLLMELLWQVQNNLEIE